MAMQVHSSLPRATLIGPEGFDDLTASPHLGNKVSPANSMFFFRSSVHRVFLPISPGGGHLI